MFDINKIKLFVTDMDGTIISNYTDLDEPTMQLIEEFGKRNIYFVPATGRPYGDAKITLRRANPFPKYNIMLNGSILLEDEKVIYGQKIEMESVKQVIDFMVKNDIVFGFYDAKSVYEVDEPKVSFSSLIKYFEQFGPQTYFVENMITVHDASELKNDIYKFETFVEDTSKTFGFMDGLRKIDNIEVSNSDMHTIEITAKGVSKGNAMQFLMNYLNITPDEVIVCGDQMNDYSMMQYGCHVLAPENACDKVKEKAEKILDTCANSGIEKYLLQLMGK